MSNLKTVNDYNDAGLVFDDGDAFETTSGPSNGFTETAQGVHIDNSWIPIKFAWRNNTGVKPDYKGMIEIKFRDGQIMSGFNFHTDGWALGEDNDITQWRPLIKPNLTSPDKPTYTQVMCDAGELPPIGARCMADVEGEWHESEVFSHYDSVVHVKMINDGCYAFCRDLNDIKPLTPPITLIDGKAYQFDSHGETRNGIYGMNSLINNEGDFAITSCTNIKGLTHDRI